MNSVFSNPLGKLAAPTPDHFVPVLYSLGLTDSKDEIRHFYEYWVNFRDLATKVLSLVILNSRKNK